MRGRAALGTHHQTSDEPWRRSHVASTCLVRPSAPTGEGRRTYIRLFVYSTSYFCFQTLCYGPLVQAGLCYRGSDSR